MIALRVLPAVVGPAVAMWRLGPKVEGQPVAEIPGWGVAFDPLGDCSIEHDGTSLEIGVPGTLHDFSVERGRIHAPRVLREVDGDFVAEVAVVGHAAPQGGPTSTAYLPYHGAGLLVWLDRDNYIRYERAAILRGGGLVHYVNFELRSNANMGPSTGQPVEEGPIALHLERRGGRVTAAYRVEGQDWVRLKKELGVRGWGDSLKVGVAAANTATAPFNAEFRDFRAGPASDWHGCRELYAFSALCLVPLCFLTFGKAEGRQIRGTVMNSRLGEIRRSPGYRRLAHTAPGLVG